MASTFTSNPVTDRANTVGWQFPRQGDGAPTWSSVTTPEHACLALSWYRSSGALALLQLKIQGEAHAGHLLARQLAQDQLRRLLPIW